MASEGKVWGYILGGVAAILGVSAIASAGSKKPKAKAMYMPGETAHLWMGQMFTVRLPRGEYQLVSEKVKQVHVASAGSNTDLMLIAGTSHASYQEKAIFIALGTGKQFFVNVVVSPHAMGEK